MNFRTFYLEALANGKNEDEARTEASIKLARYQRNALRNRNINDAHIVSGF